MPGGCTLSTLVVLSCPAPQHQLRLSMPLKTHKLKHPARPHQRLPSHGSIRTAPGRGSLPLRDSSCRSSSDRVLTSLGTHRNFLDVPARRGGLISCPAPISRRGERNSPMGVIQGHHKNSLGMRFRSAGPRAPYPCPFPCRKTPR